MALSIKPQSLYKDSDSERLINITDYVGVHRSAFRRDYARVIHSPSFRRLQGKMQLFPVHESDYFRNRLTHSLEVAQIAKSIASRINATNSFFSSPTMQIDTDLIETISLAHDLGHPPFGHNGEELLDKCMADLGGFEGNAQTLRILCRLEKRDTIQKSAEHKHQPIIEGTDNRAGLNLTFRTLAGILKYDYLTPEKKQKRKNQEGPSKGYYFTELNIVDLIKSKVGFDKDKTDFKDFKTIECSIMDIADDIAYSTYDLDDSLKAGFLDPLGMVSNHSNIVEDVLKKIRDRLNKFYPDLQDKDKKINAEDLYSYLYASFPSTFVPPQEITSPAAIAAHVNLESKIVGNSGYVRHAHTSSLVGKFIEGVEVIFVEDQPWLSRARLRVDVFKHVEVLKNFTFYATIMSPRIRVVAHRGGEIVKEIFDAITSDDGHRLMPDDFRSLHDSMTNKSVEQKRIICDYISGMTDRYAVQFYGRLRTTNPESIYSPL